MPWLLKNESVALDPWVEPTDEQDLPVAHAIISLARWQSLEPAATLPSPLGVVLEPDQDVRPLAPSLAGLDLIAFRFPKFTDGRPATRARVLRERFGFRGEVRAIGEVLIDQLQLLRRCGFDSFVMPDSEPPKRAIGELRRFSVRFQPDVSGTHPLRSRRL